MLLNLLDVSIPADEYDRKIEIVRILTAARERYGLLEHYDDFPFELYISKSTAKRAFDPKNTKQIKFVTLLKLCVGMKMTLLDFWAILCLNYPQLQASIQSITKEDGLTGLDERLYDAGLPLVIPHENDDEEY